MDERHHGGDGHLELVADRHVDDDRRDGHKEGQGGGPRDVGTPVGTYGRDRVGLRGEAELLGSGRGMLVGQGGVGGVRAHEEAVLALGHGRLDRGGALVRLREGIPHLLDGNVPGVAEVDLGATLELDAEHEAAHHEAHDGKDDQHQRDREELLAMRDEGNLEREVATHGTHHPSRRA